MTLHPLRLLPLLLLLGLGPGRAAGVAAGTTAKRR